MPLDVATLAVNVVSDSVGLADQRLNQLYATSQRVSAGLQGMLAIAGVALGFRELVQSVSQSEVALGQMEVRLRMTKGAVGITALGMRDLANEVSRLSAYNATNVISAEAVLLRYNRIGREAFPRALMLAADLGRAMGTDLTSAAFRLGRALQDPITGLTMLRREGISFDEAMIKQIQTAFRQGEVLKAQDLIMRQVGISVRGAAEAYRNTLAGSLETVRNSFDELFERMGSHGVSAALREVSERMAEFVNQDEKGVQVMADLVVSATDMVGGILEELYKLVRWAEENPGIANFLGWGLGIGLLATGHFKMGATVLGAAYSKLPEGHETDFSGLPLDRFKPKPPYVPSKPLGYIPIMKAPESAFFGTTATEAYAGTGDQGALDKIKQLQMQADLQQRLTAIIRETSAVDRDNVLATSEQARALNYAAEAQKLQLELGDKVSASSLAQAQAALRLSLVSKDEAADLMEVGKIMQATLDPMEQMAQKTDRIRELWSQGRMELGEYNRALKFYQGTLAIQQRAGVEQAQFGLEAARLGRAGVERGVGGVAAQYAATELEYQQKIAKYKADTLDVGQKINEKTLANLELEKQLVQATNLQLAAKQVLAETATPEQQLAAKYADLTTLVGSGALSAEQATVAAKQYHDQILNIASATDQMKTATVDAFQVINSSFEKAMLNGAEFNEVLSGALNDLQKIVQQKLIEEPMQAYLNRSLERWKKGEGFFSAFFTSKEPAMPNFGAVPVNKDLSNVTVTNGALNVNVVNLGGKMGVGDLFGQIVGGGGLGEGMLSLLGGGKGNEATDLIGTIQESISGGIIPSIDTAFSAGASQTWLQQLGQMFTSQQGGGGFLAGLGSIFSGLFSGIGGMFGGGGGGGFDIFGSILGWVGALFMAQGGAFQNGRPIPFVKGGVVTRPTLFPMAGGMGLMGESGPEAVLPLLRMAGGNLGVHAKVNEEKPVMRVNIYNNSDQKVETRQHRDGRGVDVIIGEVVAKDIRDGGAIWRSLETNAGLKRTPIGR